MARKNIFDFSEQTEPSQKTDDRSTHASFEQARPLAGLDRDRANRPAALGAISQSLEKINERSARADEIERQLSTGQTIVELDPDLIDSSFVSDRLGFDDEDQTKLIEQIRDSGQLVPILVRPHPQNADRFQIAYGHRRVAAIKALGIKVRAVVKQLTDEELVIHQGQENNTRSNLSFIEKAFFAYILEGQGYSRETLYQSTGIDKAILSKMITIIKSIPEEIIRKIGRAPSIGRTRWEEFVGLLTTVGEAVATDAIGSAGFSTLPSDDRFQFVFDALKLSASKDKRQKNAVLSPVLGDGIQPVSIKRAGKNVQFTFNDKAAPQFADFIQSRLEELYAEYKASEAPK
ncbi:plasmid partitioning protein RepB [Ochrobactrum soli]|uniref:Plasmid replication protein RepB n=1 Tax=Ochrobactrum soli TaxID=2448455 RepID=A0A2P9HB64_9HYPH|nr:MULTISPECIES: plasmid partitioning protein RepB [Brucella]MCI1002538.1 plasmid partitioning protein RepB [Ochrobactrum sp. C6C9]WHT45364.1 plasmid partitioning protein RepB [Ochrobactrum sp. SSR]RLL64347.1 plasmid partitioning protein RepB [[Ochrobactrum] soli]WHS30295.1 plasmid partitioning protein RepB [Brucella sp. NM4]SPL61275.1 Plasmid replication protein RepB [[Ochrobactrum] soli]